MFQTANGNPVADAVSVEQVLATIQAALSVDTNLRSSAEATLRAWEADAAPGFLIALLRIVEQQAIDAATRLLAAVIAKNAVGSSWRKTLGTREWSRVPEEEKSLVKEATINMMLQEPVDRISTQLTLLLTNIARFDFPGRAQDLLGRLLAAAQNVQLPPEARLRAMKALCSILAGLSTKRFVIEAPPLGAGGPTGLTDLRQLSQHINAERELFKTRLAEAFPPLTEVFAQHCEAFIACAAGWDFHGPMAKAAATAAAELLSLTPVPPEQLPSGAERLMTLMHAACLALTHAQPSNPQAYASLAPQQQAHWRELAGRLCERMTRAIIACLDHYAIPFASLLPPFLQLYVENALIQLDAVTVRAMRPKRRVLMVRFIAKALLCPFYRPEWVNAPVPAALPQNSPQNTFKY